MGAKGPASWKSECEPSPLRLAPADGSLRPGRGDPGSPKRRRGGEGVEALRGELGSPFPSSLPSLSPPPLLYVFFLLSSLASLSPLESEGASRLGAGAGYVSQTVTCSLPVSFSCVLK